MKMVKMSAVVVAISIGCSSCGVIFGGSRYNAQIVVKNHPDAIIKANGNEIGKGTAVGSFKRNAPLQIEITEPGCASKSQTYDTTIRGGNLALSLFTWGLVGPIVDFVTGACFKPDHRNNKDITRTDKKNFVYTIDYSQCESTSTK